MMIPTTDDVHIVGLLKEEHRYLWLFYGNQGRQVLDSIAATAVNRQLNFGHWERALLTEEVRIACCDAMRR